VRARLVHLVSERVPEGEDFGELVAADLGPAEGKGADLFEVTVCTRRWLANVSTPKGYAFLRHHLVVERWDEELVRRAISDLCLRNEGDD
jgi:hypothetical protein